MQGFPGFLRVTEPSASVSCLPDHFPHSPSSRGWLRCESGLGACADRAGARKGLNGNAVRRGFAALPNPRLSLQL